MMQKVALGLKFAPDFFQIAPSAFLRNPTTSSIVIASHFFFWLACASERDSLKVAIHSLALIPSGLNVFHLKIKCSMVS